VQVAEGNTLQIGGDGAPVRFGGISVRGGGNAEGRGALRLAANASLLDAPLTLLGDTTIASDSSVATFRGCRRNGDGGWNERFDARNGRFRCWAYSERDDH
jgi:hypothetical protein